MTKNPQNILLAPVGLTGAASTINSYKIIVELFSAQPRRGKEGQAKRFFKAAKDYLFSRIIIFSVKHFSNQLPGIALERLKFGWIPASNPRDLASQGWPRELINRWRQFIARLSPAALLSE